MEVATLLRGANVNNVIKLKREGLSISRISEITTFDRKTIRKYLLDTDSPIYGPRAPRAKMLVRRR